MVWQERIQKLKVTPDKPGVYLLKDSSEAILYVGKASSLRTRLRSYFSSPSKLDGKLKYLIKHASDFDYIVTNSETEALILENTYIKRYKPHYNIRLKDDKTYPYIKIALKDSFPRPEITRQRLNDGAQYFGPYTNAKSIRHTMNLLNRLFPYRTCSKVITGTDLRPCLEFYINRCAAPCTGEISSSQYHDIINQLIKFLNGKTNEVTNTLTKSMKTASQLMNYEKAAKLRDQIQAIKHVYETQTVISKNKESIDVLGLAVNGKIAWIEVLHVRYGIVTGRDNFQMVKVNEEDTGSILGSFVKQYYAKSSHIPHVILSQVPINDSETIILWLASMGNRRVKLTVPRRGKQLQLLKLASINADYGLRKFQFQSDSDPNQLTEGISALSHFLHLGNLPWRIECFDISNTQGTNPVGSMVVFINGKSQKSLYRKFSIKSVNKSDDYAMMQEVLRRRLFYLVGFSQKSAVSFQSQDTSFSQIPDLILIDGGKGHLSTAVEVLNELKLNHIPLASIAKKEELIFVPNQSTPIKLPFESPAMYLVQRIRDEAHRFAITFHRMKRSKQALRSSLDSIPGIGSVKKKQLIEKFGSVQNIRRSSVEIIATTPGLNNKLAEIVKKHLMLLGTTKIHKHRSA